MAHSKLSALTLMFLVSRPLCALAGDAPTPASCQAPEAQTGGRDLLARPQGPGTLLCRILELGGGDERVLELGGGDERVLELGGGGTATAGVAEDWLILLLNALLS